MIQDFLIALVFAAAAALGLQIGSAISALVDAAGVKDSDEPDVITRRRMRELVWTLAVLAAVAVFIAFGVDWAARLAWDERSGWALLVLVCTALAAFVAGAIGAIAIVARERPTYARLRRDLRDRSSFTLDASETTDFEARLERADLVRARRPRASLILKIIGLVLVVVVGVLLAVVWFSSGAWLAWLAVVAVVVHCVSFAVALWAGGIHRERLEEVLDAQRDEVVALLERARIPQRSSVPGLRDRVTRALAILREKQR